MRKSLDSMSGDLGSIAENLERIAVSLERMVGLFEGVGRAARLCVEPMAMVVRMVEGNKR